jgi:thiol-disulfide isomerase/thioredoxin
MSLQEATPPSRPARNWVVATAFVAALALIIGTTAYTLNRSGAQDPKVEKPDVPPQQIAPGQPAPELDGGVAWLNTAGAVHLKDLRGKIVVLDFWTLCCINCMHTLPELAKLEKKYPNELVVIGVHTPKFENEKETESIRKAILRYEVKHPVVNDANMRLWQAYGVQSWPTLVLIDPEGKLVGGASGEGHREQLDAAIGQLIKIHKAKKTLDEKPLKFELAKEAGASPLYFPGKVLADGPGNRLFISDSTHHRIIITDLDGKKIAIAGTGEAGTTDGLFANAQFNDPQGLALDGDKLYVADRKNHLIRALDLKARTVTTIAGTGKQGQSRAGINSPLKAGLNSPWDLLKKDNLLFIAMAGHHQIWVLDLDKQLIGPYAGTGQEDIHNDALGHAMFAQPSGLTTDGTNLYVADSEVSAIRMLPMNGKGEVHALLGEHLFKFGDIEFSPARRMAMGFGEGFTYRLQHALGVAYVDGKVYVADTYNNKLKVLDPKTRRITTLQGDSEGWQAKSVFEAPAGLSYSDGKLYVADTNAHRIRVVDLKTRALSTLKLQGVDAPKAP